MHKTFRYRLYPTTDQQFRLSNTLELCCNLYNAALQERRDAYKMQGKSLTFVTQSSELPNLKEVCPEFTGVYSQVLQDVLHRTDKAFKAFFRRVQSNEKPGYPRFKNYNRYDSFTYPQLGFEIKDSKLYLSKIGCIKIKMHRNIFGKIKTLNIKREANKWYACFSCDIGDAPPKKTIKAAVGIDVGLESFAILSDGTTIENPRYFRKSEDILADRQRRLISKIKGSQRRCKSRLLVVKAHTHIRNQRVDFLHKLAHEIANKYDFIAYEDLNIRGMVRNHCLAKSISDAAWGIFLQFLSYEAEEAGSTVMPVNPKGTSIDCSECGFSVSKSLNDRIHSCSNCGTSISRDLNAARNILRLGLSHQAVHA